MAAQVWRRWEEWQQVYSDLYSTCTDHWTRALTKVSAWRARGNIPVAIDAVAQFRELQLHEQLAQRRTHATGVSARSNMELQLMYASAVLRCVNGVVDGAQQRGAYAGAVSILAQRMGLPLWIVDLRHASTHNQLPALPVLRLAAEHLVAWAEANYWRPQQQLLEHNVLGVGQYLMTALQVPTDTMDAFNDSNFSIQVGVVRQVAVSLLVFGHQYGVQVASTGLLFVSDCQLEQTQDVLSKLQALWPPFSAALLAGLCHKVLADTTVQTEVDKALVYIDMLLSDAWKLHLPVQGTEHLYVCGAEMLSHARQLSSATSTCISQLVEKLETHPDIGNHRSEAESATSDGWKLLSSWTPCPLGRYGNCILDDNELEYSVELDTSADSSYVDALDATADEVEDALADMDKEYLAHLEHIVHVRDDMIQDVVRRGQSAGQVLLAESEVERIQQQVEIW